MSQFAGLFKSLKNEETPTAKSSAPTKETQAQPKSREPKNAPVTKGKPKTSSQKSSVQNKNLKPVIVARGPSKTLNKKAETKVMSAAKVSAGRRPGKSSNPEYTQVLSYIRKTTYKEVKRALLDNSEQDFSELIENLLSQWLISKN